MCLQSLANLSLTSIAKGGETSVLQSLANLSISSIAKGGETPATADASGGTNAQKHFLKNEYQQLVLLDHIDIYVYIDNLMCRLRIQVSFIYMHIV